MAKVTLDELVREADGRRIEPFEVDMGDGQTFTLVSPKDLTINEFLLFDFYGPKKQVSLLMGDQFDAFCLRSDVDGYIFEVLRDRFMAHFGLGTPGNANASPATSNATAGQSKRTSRSGGSTSSKS